MLFILAFSTVASFAQVDVSNQSKEILSATKNLFIKIADSKIDVNSLSLTDDKLVEGGVLKPDELNMYISIIKSNGGEVSKLLSLNEDDYKDCLGCQTSDDKKIEKLRSVISSIRNDKEGFIVKFDKFTENVVLASRGVTRKTAFGDSGGPNCSWAFYACLGVGSGASGGVAIALVIYVCACSFCELHPPGC